MKTFIRIATIFGLVSPVGAQDIAGVVEWIEIPTEALQQLLIDADAKSDGADFRQQALDSGGVIRDSSGFRGRIGKELLLVAAKDNVYPAEYDPAEINEAGASHPAVPAAMETRQVGFRSRINSTNNARSVKVAIDAEWIQFLGNRKHGQGLSAATMPDFFRMGHVGEISVRPGKMISLVSTFETPKPGANALLFLHTDVPKSSKTADEIPENQPLRLVFETYETEIPRLYELFIASQDSDRIPQLLETLRKEADFVDGRFHTANSGARLKCVSALELMYPSEFDPPVLSGDGKELIPNHPGAYETRWVGSVAEMDPVVEESGFISINPNLSRVMVEAEIDYQREVSSAPFPGFHTQEIVLSKTLAPGVVDLIGTTRPPTALDPKRKLPIRVYFVRVLD